MSTRFVQSIRRALLCMAVLAAAAPATAQLTRGIISGVVTDTDGGVMPGVTVTITNQDTGVVRATVTNDSGVYRAPALEPGTYTVRAELQGFRTFETRNIRVASGQEVTLNASLAVGGLEETVQVTAETAGVSINRTNATVGLVPRVSPGRGTADLADARRHARGAAVAQRGLRARRRRASRPTGSAPATTTS